MLDPGPGAGPHLFSPLEIRAVNFRNRIGVSPMCQYSSLDGLANEWHLVHLGARAVGGAGLVMAEATAVTPEGRISPADLGLWKEEHVEPLARVAAFIRSQGAVAGIQLAHAGRKASTAPPFEGGGPVDPSRGGWRPIFGPSPEPLHPDGIVPQALDEAGIEAVIAAFAAAAERAARAGFQVLELHAAHGYLLHEFLSPLSNRRTDRWGGSFENRIRLVLAVVGAVRRVWPEECPLFLRLSATDWTDGGWTPRESVRLARRAGAGGVDLIDCSSGGNVAGAAIPLGPGYQVHLAQLIGEEARIRTGAVGLITSPEQADAVIRERKADMVFLAREMLRQPNWPLLAATALGQAIDWPRQYERARPPH